MFLVLGLGQMFLMSLFWVETRPPSNQQKTKPLRISGREIHQYSFE